jgi:hypothetical protein
VASIPRQIQTDFIKLTTLFQGTFKTAADRHKCDDTLPQKKKNKVAVAFLGDLKFKNSLCIGSQGFLKVEEIWRLFGGGSRGFFSRC